MAGPAKLIAVIPETKLALTDLTHRVSLLAEDFGENLQIRTFHWGHFALFTEGKDCLCSPCLRELNDTYNMLMNSEHFLPAQAATCGHCGWDSCPRARTHENPCVNIPAEAQARGFYF